jgi:hypothetical protein
MEKCSVEGCDRPREYWFVKYCAAHEQRVRRTGSPGSPIIRKYMKTMKRRAWTACPTRCRASRKSLRADPDTQPR